MIVADRASANDPAANPSGRSMHITVAIPTCSRASDLSRCLASLSRLQYPSWDLLIVDQSEDNETRDAVIAWGALIPKIAYLRLEQQNASIARNVALEHASGEVVAFIDDDCTVTPNWLARVCEAFVSNGDIALVLGAVTAAEHDPSEAYLPIFQPKADRCLYGRLGALRVSGMGASMYLRLNALRSAFFDPCLGPGGRYRSSQDTDYAYRMLAAGNRVFQTPSIEVTHHGARRYADGTARTKLFDYLFGFGAVQAKLLRCGDWIMLAVIATNFARLVAQMRLINALERRPTNVGRVVAYVSGLRAGFQAPVDRTSRLFR